ncbi:unnamed protein product [Ranitomeya imitator]|uniref:Ribose-phosphate pyrophosphokinase N-terminal domain-containing protein n=1 Tax=Ranitomeya imitator TaxID=111125 RepID=A0ABN9LR04_9NEOB|nr:unnamed protein product [Ranitomeya imitator]
MLEDFLVPDMKLFAGNAIPELAHNVLPKPPIYLTLGDAAVSRFFSDGEVSVQINENFHLCPNKRQFNGIVFMVDALRRASAGRITAVIPYFVMLRFAKIDVCVQLASLLRQKVVADFPLKCLVLIVF